MIVSVWHWQSGLRAFSVGCRLRACISGLHACSVRRTLATVVLQLVWASECVSQATSEALSTSRARPCTKRYADKYLLVQPQLVDFVAHCGRGHIIESIIGHRIKPKMELQVVWSTYSLAEPTWEPFSTIVRAIPVDVSRYIKTIVNPAERARLHASYKSLKPSK